MDLRDIYQIFCPNKKEYTFFSVPQVTFSEIDHILRQKASLNRNKEIGIIRCILSDKHRIRKDTNKGNKRKLMNAWKLDNSLLNKKCAKTEIKKLRTFKNSIKVN